MLKYEASSGINTICVLSNTPPRVYWEYAVYTLYIILNITQMMKSKHTYIHVGYKKGFYVIFTETISWWILVFTIHIKGSSLKFIYRQLDWWKWPKVGGIPLNTADLVYDLIFNNKHLHGSKQKMKQREVLTDLIWRASMTQLPMSYATHLKGKNH